MQAQALLRALVARSACCLSPLASLPAACASGAVRSIAGPSASAAGGLGSQMSDNDPDALAYHKEKHFKGETPTVMPQAEGWSETLASVSEAVVKAERLVLDNTAMSDPVKLKELQQQTIEVVQKLHHATEANATKSDEHDLLSRSSAHQENLQHTKNTRGLSSE